MENPTQAHLQAEDAELETRWQALAAWIEKRFSHDTSVEAILFLIGIQSRARGYEPELDKDRKQDLIMEGTYCAFETLGMYERVGLETDGLWIWERSYRLPDLSVEEQEKLLRIAILRYFDETLPEQL